MLASNVGRRATIRKRLANAGHSHCRANDAVGLFVRTVHKSSQHTGSNQLPDDEAHVRPGGERDAQGLGQDLGGICRRG